MHQDWTIEGWEEAYVNAHNWVANCWLGMLISLIITGWCRWCSRHRWYQFWCRLPESVGGASIPLSPLRVCGFFVVTFWQGRDLSVWFWWSIARCLSIPAFNILCPANSTPRFFSFWTLVGGFLMRYCISSIAACKNPPLSILAIFKARCMSDCSSCTRPPRLAIVADMFKTYKKLVAASNNDIQLLPLP